MPLECADITAIARDSSDSGGTGMKRLSVIAVLGMAGCTVGPDYQVPTTAIPADWQQSVEAESAITERWWEAFASEELDRLVEQALLNNRDLQAAQWRIVEAQAASASAQGARLPSLSVEASYTNFEQSIESPQTAGPLIAAGVVPRTGEFYTVNGLASWEIDPFGGLRRAAQAAGARAEGASAAADGAALQVIAETVSAYNDWQNFAARVEVAERNVALQQRTLDIIEGKVRLGLVRQLDAERARAELERLRSTVPQLVAARIGARERLALLVGTTSNTLKLSTSTEDLAAPATIGLGTPAELLRRRPDVRAAERSLAAATATTGQAVAAFFPSLALNAQGGFEAEKADDLGTGDARAVGIVPFVRWPVFQGGRLRAQLRAAEASERQAYAAYEQAVLGAIADTESSLAAWRGAEQSLSRISVSRGAAGRAADLADRLYREGLVDYLSLLDAQRQLASVEDAEVAAQGQLVLAAVQLYKALGGGWEAVATP